METKPHWEKIYHTKAPDQVSWYQVCPELSLKLIQQTGVNSSASIIDVGGGASTLVDFLLQNEFANLTVLDLSATALETSKRRLGDQAHQVTWIEADITQAHLPPHGYDVWHDRAVFHFLTQVEDRHRYVEQVKQSVKPDGFVIVATFGPEGPLRCSGLEIVRYSPDALHSEFGADFQLLESRQETHQTPFGSEQQFIYCFCRRTR